MTNIIEKIFSKKNLPTQNHAYQKSPKNQGPLYYFTKIHTKPTNDQSWIFKKFSKFLIKRVFFDFDHLPCIKHKNKKTQSTKEQEICALCSKTFAKRGITNHFNSCFHLNKLLFISFFLIVYSRYDLSIFL